MTNTPPAHRSRDEYLALKIGFDLSTIAHQLDLHGLFDIAFNVWLARDHEEAAWLVGMDWERYRVGDTEWSDPFIGRHIRGFVDSFDGWGSEPATPPVFD